MATSDSDDFESADEELGAQATPSRKQLSNQWTSPSSAVDSESDDDNECMPAVNSTTTRNSGNRSVQTSGQERRARSSTGDTPTELRSESKKSTNCAKRTESNVVENAAQKENVSPPQTEKCTKEKSEEPDNPAKAKNDEPARKLSFSTEDSDNQPETKENEPVAEKSSSIGGAGRRERPQRSRKPKESKNLGAKKLGAKMDSETPAIPPLAGYASSPQEIRAKALAEGKEPPMIEECWEFDEEETAKILHGMKNLGIPDGEKVKMPEELTSDKKFKEIFKPDGWEGIDDEAILSELEDERVRPVLDKIATVHDEQSNAGWGNWGSWGVSSFINSATAGVSTLTSHVTHGLTLLDEAMGAPNPEEFVKNESPDGTDSIDEKSLTNQEMPQLSFGFNDLLSGVSSITKLVETTGTKVITGGLGTLETIGKKTMEVLQDGDPGLKKKRAFFLNESDKPILSQMLREAKEKAEVEEKTLEEKQLSRKVHFESLFDDYQGLVHLEALEMLSKQSNMKIQQRLVSLDADELTSLQETLEEVKELCDLGEDDEEDDNQDNLPERLKAACKDLGVAITYEKLDEIWKDTRAYISEISSPESITTEREVFQRAISTLARFTAFSVERFHKTAELLLIKERRSTVNEADALVQLTRILSGQIGIAANSFSNWLNERMKTVEKTDRKVDITTIFLEAANASSYIQDAFRLLIPILQVGAI